MQKIQESEFASLGKFTAEEKLSFLIFRFSQGNMPTKILVFPLQGDPFSYKPLFQRALRYKLYCHTRTKISFKDFFGKYVDGTDILKFIT